MNEAVAIVIGAGLASGFGIITAVIQHFLAKGTEKKKEKRARLENAYRYFVSYSFLLNDYWDFWKKYYKVNNEDYSTEAFKRDIKNQEILTRDSRKEIELYLKVYYRDLVAQWIKVADKNIAIFDFFKDMKGKRSIEAEADLVARISDLNSTFNRFTNSFLKKYSKDIE